MCSTRSVPLVLGPLRGLGRLPGRVVTSATGTLACRGHARSPRARERSGSNASVLTRSRRASVPHGGPQRRAGVRGASESRDPLCLGPELGPPGGEQAVLADVSQGLWGQCCCSADLTPTCHCVHGGRCGLHRRREVPLAGAGACGAVVRGPVRRVPCLLTKGFTICRCHSFLNTTIEISGLTGPPRPGDSRRLWSGPGPSTRPLRDVLSCLRPRFPCVSDGSNRSVHVAGFSCVKCRVRNSGCGVQPSSPVALRFDPTSV